jgi:hypothetical protein
MTEEEQAQGEEQERNECQIGCERRPLGAQMDAHRLPRLERQRRENHPVQSLDGVFPRA